MTNTSATSAPTTTCRRRVLAYVLATLAFGTISLGVVQGADARPMLDPCQYDHTCITTTVRR